MQASIAVPARARHAGPASLHSRDAFADPGFEDLDYRRPCPLRRTSLTTTNICFHLAGKRRSRHGCKKTLHPSTMPASSSEKPPVKPSSSGKASRLPFWRAHHSLQKCLRKWAASEYATSCPLHWHSCFADRARGRRPLRHRCDLKT